MPGPPLLPRTQYRLPVLRPSLQASTDFPSAVPPPIGLLHRAAQTATIALLPFLLSLYYFLG